MAYLTPDQVDSLESKLNNVRNPQDPVDPVQQARMAQLQADAMPDDPRVATAQPGPYGDAGLLAAKEKMIAARKELASSLVVGNQGLDSFVNNIIDRAGQVDSIEGKLNMAREKYILDKTAKGEINPANAEEAANLAYQPQSNRRMELNPELQKKLQGDLVLGFQNLADLHQLLDDFNPEFFRAKGQGVKALGDIISKYGGSLPPEMEAFGDKLDNYTQLANKAYLGLKEQYAVGRVPESIKKLITGATFNIHDDPDSFKAKLKGLTIAQERSYAMKREMLANGIVPGQVSADEYRKGLDAARIKVIQEHPEFSDHHIAEQFYRAKHPGMTPSQIIIRDAILKKGGRPEGIE